MDAIGQVLRLAVVADAFLAQVFYRAKASLQRHRIPLLPHIFHRLAIQNAGVCIGDPVLIEPGLYLAHGQVVIDGVVRIKRGVAIFPWVTIGLRPPALGGATIGRSASIGTGAKVLGEVTIGHRARVGANAVVLDDVPDDRSVIGIPARLVEVSGDGR
ncbi:MAG: serine acetyltransferase [Acidimicrobiales bacterium]|nr:serine acetyltransferase [Acidimicrobiales bacterium]